MNMSNTKTFQRKYSKFNNSSNDHGTGNTTASQTTFH